MKKLSALLLTLCLLAAALCVPAAAEDGYTLTLCAGETTVLQHVTTYTLPAAEAPGKVFAGWRTHEAALYPAGAAFTLSADTTLEALFVEMTVLSPELRLCGENDTAIRFLTNVNAADYTALSAVAEVSLGTVIAPRSYVSATAGNVLTPEAIALGGHTKYLDVPAGGFYRTGTDTLTIAGSVSSIRAENSTMPFLGVGYLSVRYANGTATRLYAPTDKSCAGSYYPLLCAAAEDETLPAGESARYAAVLGGFVSVHCKSPTEYAVNAGSKAFTLRFSKEYSYDGDFILTIKPDTDFRFDRDMRALILDGVMLSPGSYTIREGGTVLTLPYSEYSDNY